MLKLSKQNISAQNFNIEEILPSEMGSLLLEKGELSHLLTENNNEPVFIPEVQFSEDIKSFVFSNITDNMGYGGEKLYILNKSDIENNAQTPLGIDEVSVIMRSISKMQGMMYFSRSRKEWDVLYKEAYRIESPDIKDPPPALDLNETAADEQTIYAFMNDHTFGRSVYKIAYKQKDNEFAMFMENYSALSYGPVKAVKPGDFKMCVSIVDCGDKFLFYIGNYAEFKIISSLKKRLNNSFEARLEAIFNWFKGQLGGDGNE